MTADASLEHRMVLRWTRTVSRVLQVGTLSGILVIAARIFNPSGEVKIWEIDHIPLKATWVAFLLLTVIHGFTGLFLVRAIEELRRTCPLDEQKAAYEDVLVEAGGYMSITIRRLQVPGKRVAMMSVADASTWVAHCGALLMFVSVLPWWWQGGVRWPGWGASLAIFGISVVLTAANWIIGSIWAVGISRIGTPRANNASHSGPRHSTPWWSVMGGVISISQFLLFLLFSIGGATIGGAIAWLIRLLITQRQ